MPELKPTTVQLRTTTPVRPESTMPWPVVPAKPRPLQFRVTWSAPMVSPTSLHSASTIGSPGFRAVSVIAVSPQAHATRVFPGPALSPQLAAQAGTLEAAIRARDASAAAQHVRTQDSFIDFPLRPRPEEPR